MEEPIQTAQENVYIILVTILVTRILQRGRRCLEVSRNGTTPTRRTTQNVGVSIATTATTATTTTSARTKQTGRDTGTRRRKTKKVNKRPETTKPLPRLVKRVLDITQKDQFKNVYLSSKGKSLRTILFISTLFVLSLVQAQSMGEKPKHFTIFDSVGQVASGMAYVHVAIPLNLSTFEIQAAILGDYLFKLSRVVDYNSTDRITFMTNIREIAKFGQVKLQRLINRAAHLDAILPYDGDLTQERQNRQRRTPMDTINDDEVIDLDKFMNRQIRSPINISEIVTDQDILKTHNKIGLQFKIDKLKEEADLFFKHAKLNNHHRFKRQSLKAIYYTKDLKSQFKAELLDELHIMRLQAHRINKIRQDIQQDNSLIGDKLIELTKHQWTPDMDRIIGDKGFTMLHSNLRSFQQHMDNYFPENLYKDIGHREVTRTEDETITADNDMTSNDIPPWTYIHNTSYNTRQKRDDMKEYVVTYKEMYINDNRTLELSCVYRNLQIEVNDLIIETVADLKENIEAHKRLAKYEKLKAKGTKTEFFRFEDIFKDIPNSTKTEFNPHSRQKRVAPLLVVGGIAGVLGTFMGMYNMYEISKLKERLNDMDKNHNLLVHVTERQEEQINRITENMNAICLLIKLMTEFNPALIAEQITAQINLFETRLTMATNAVQQLQHRRLAVDFLDTLQLEEMHKAIQVIANSRQYTLMPERLSDYFQLEASYLRNGKDILIMLHVPCIIHDQLLTLYKYIPLPFPIPKFITTETTTIADLIELRTGQTEMSNGIDMDALVIVPEAEMIAVGTNDKFRILSQGDLASCIKRNKIYLCENHQVLHTDLSNSCLGSIYSNYEKGIKLNCKLQRKRLTETVYQLSPLDYLIFTPEPYKATIDCKSGNDRPIFLTQIYKLHVPEDCQINLKSHTIVSDYNIRITPPPLDVPWSLDPLQLPADILLDAALIDNKLNTLERNLRELLNDTSKKTDFKSMINTSFKSPFTYPWFIWATIFASIAALGLLAFWYIYNTVQNRRYIQQNTEQQQPQNPNIHQVTKTNTIENPSQKQTLYPPVYNL